MLQEAFTEHPERNDDGINAARLASHALR